MHTKKINADESSDPSASHLMPATPDQTSPTKIKPLCKTQYFPQDSRSTKTCIYLPV